MNDEAWKKAWQVYRNAPETARSAVLNTCRLDSGRLDALLREHDLSQAQPDAVSASVASWSGTSVGKYRVGDLIGAGGAGQVYAGIDATLHRKIAIKFLRAESGLDGAGLEKLVDEACHASSLNHPYIVTIHEFIRENDCLAMVMEFVEGCTLRARVPDIRIDEALEIARQIGEALERAHSSGIVHLDLKPENVMIRPDGYVKLLDFGLARLFLQESNEPYRVAGTWLYMSPEQASAGRLTPASDIYSFGLLLQECLLHSHPFAALEDPPHLTTRTNIALAEHRAKLPVPLRHLLANMTAPDPLHRPPAHVVVGELQRIIAARRQKAQSKVIALAAACSLLIVALLAVLYFAHRPVNEPVFTPVPLAVLSGRKVAPSFSPSGDRIAFAWDESGLPGFHIFIQKTDGSGLHQLTAGDGNEYAPAWSPDGRDIAFVMRMPSGQCALAVVPSNGGKPAVVATLHFEPIFQTRTLAWAADSQAIFFTDFEANHHMAIAAVDLRTRTRKLVTQANASAWFSQVAASPSGKWLAIVEWRQGVERILLSQLIGRFAADTPKPLPLAGFEKVDVNSPVWGHDGKHLFFLSPKGHFSGRLWTLDFDDGRVSSPRPISSLGEFIYTPDVAANGDIAYARVVSDYNLKRVRLPVPDPSSSAPMENIAFSTLREVQPVLSPDGRRLSFVSERSGAAEIWISNVNGGDGQQLTHFGGPQVWSPSWSPDGSRIAFEAAGIDGKLHVNVIPSMPGYTPVQLNKKNSFGAMPEWDPSGTHIYYISDITGIVSVWRMRPDGSGAEQVVKTTSYSPVVSRDGRFLYYADCRCRNAGIWRVPVSGGTPVRIISGSQQQSFYATNFGLLFFRPGPEERDATTVWAWRANGFQERLQATLGPQIGLSLSGTPDGRTVYFDHLDVSSSDLFLARESRGE
jgi:Tol biopolymer transport system component